MLTQSVYGYCLCRCCRLLVLLLLWNKNSFATYVAAATFLLPQRRQLKSAAKVYFTFNATLCWPAQLWSAHSHIYTHVHIYTFIRTWALTQPIFTFIAADKLKILIIFTEKIAFAKVSKYFIFTVICIDTSLSAHNGCMCIYVCGSGNV